jgi:hypothetical protein
MKRWPKLVLWLSIGILAAATAWGGNREMVERRVQELDALNRSVVQQIPELPRDGQVKLKARVKPDGTTELIETEIVRPRATNEIIRPRVKAEAPPAVADEDENGTGLRSALRSRGRGEAQIRPYRDDNSDGRYPRLRDALAAYFGKGRL